MAVYHDERLEPSDYRWIRWFRIDQFESERCLTSHFVSSKTLFWLRLPMVLYTTIVIWADIIWCIVIGEFRHFFAYFTHFTFIGLHAYLLTVCYHHAKYLLSSHPRRPTSFFDQPAILNYLFVLLYHTVITFNLLTPIVYWSLLSGELTQKANVTLMEWWMSVSLHASTLFMMLTEVCLTRTIVYTRLVLPVFGLVLLYMLLTFVIYGTEKWWVYSFLDWSQGPSAAVWYIAVALCVVICFFLQYGIHALRDWLASVFVKQQQVDKLRDEEKNDSKLSVMNSDKRYYSQTLVESSIASHITLDASSTDYLAS